MIEIDGSDGGGQVLRSSLALSALTGTPVRVENVRGDRDSPGLKRQHLTALDTIAAVCDAAVEGDDLESTAVEFDPGPVEAGHYEAEIATAGSVTLVFDTVLPLATAVEDDLTLTVTGGTDVKWSPSACYYGLAKLPLLARSGLDATMAVERRGFFPVGGGTATLSLSPSTLAPLELGERGTLDDLSITSLASADLADAEVAERQADAAVEGFEDLGYSVDERTADYVESQCPGTVVCARLAGSKTVLGYDALGERGTPAETIGERVAVAAERDLSTHTAVDAHMADQVMVALALAGGRVAIPRETDHVATNRETLAAFGYDVSVEDTAGGPVLSASTPDR